jgi:hypothetical protein
MREGGRKRMSEREIERMRGGLASVCVRENGRERERERP